MRFVAVTKVGEIPDGEARMFVVEGIAIMLARCGDEIFAVEALCSHAHAYLHEGSVDRFRCSVECPLHGAEFDLRTGRVLSPPATEPVQVFPVRCGDGNVLVGLPDGV